jgi:tetratricopeptide (TPR) repeat protein
MSKQEISKIKVQARALLEVDRFAEAAAMLGHGLAGEPRDFELLCLMSEAMIGAGRAKDAVTYAEHAIAAQPQDDDGHRLRSFALRNVDRRESVISAQRAVQINPQEPANWHALAVAEIYIFRFDQARKAAERMRALAPQSFIPHQLFALVAIKTKKYDEAEAHCRRELALNPNSYHGMNNLGVALLNRGKKREAVEAFNLAAKTDPTHELARRNLGLATRKYLPGAGALVGLGYLMTQVANIGGAAGDAGALIGLVMVMVLLTMLAIGFFVIRWQRIRQLPVEAQNYLKTLKRAARVDAVRSLLALAAVLCGIFFLIGIFFTFVLWGDGDLRGHVTAILILMGLIAVGFVSLFGFLRMTESYSQQIATHQIRERNARIRTNLWKIVDIGKNKLFPPTRQI